MRKIQLLRAARRAAAAAVPVLLAACQTPYPVPKVEFATATAPAVPASGPPGLPAPQPVEAASLPPPMVTGSLFQAAAYRPLFEDHRARLAGDTLTVQIVEKISASQKATSTLDKKGALEGGVTALPMLSVNSFNRASVSANGANTFAGKGSTESSNDFSGTITAIVTGVLPNGHLMIAGEKQIGLNQQVDVLRFTGQVDPRSIVPGNSIQSAQIANVRIEHKGLGTTADAQGIGWLGRFFLNLLPV